MHSHTLRRGLAAAGIALALGVGLAHGASHREAPLMTLDPAADITDVYAFVSYDAAGVAAAPADRKVTLIMNVVPGQEPGSGPNYFAFDDSVLYELHADNNKDGAVDDVIYQFRFQTTVDTPDQFQATVAIPPVTDLTGSGAAGESRKQRYTVTELRGCKDTKKAPKCKTTTQLFGGAMLPTVPSNIGTRTTPSYDQLAAKGIITDAAAGMRVFAGQRVETLCCSPATPASRAAGRRSCSAST